MQNPKAAIFLYLTKRQKSQLLGTLKAYCLKNPTLSTLDIIDKFFEDEKYYLGINNPHFEFIKDYFEDELFFKDLKKYFEFLKFELEQKEKLRPYFEKQKEIQKELRKKAQDFKMSKLKPTKKQLLYYDKNIKSYKINKNDTENASRLDLRNWITEILENKKSEN